MCPPVPLNSDGSLDAAAASYLSHVSCGTLRVPPPSTTSASHTILATSSAGPLTPRGAAAAAEVSRRLPSRYVSATLPEVRPASVRSGNRRCSNIAELYRKCTHHEVATEGGVPCRSVVMEYLECTAGERR